MKHVHLIGIGGTGLSAIARVLLEKGYKVSGSDLHSSSLADSLVDAGAQVYLGHQPEYVDGADIVVRSSAVPDNNVEVQASFSKGIPVVKRAEFLGQLLAGKQGIAVAGTHGKTSTTAMIAWILTELGQDPSFIIGGIISNLGINAKAGQGKAFVIEADEYDRMFLGLEPDIAVITNIEHDHPDCYPTPEDFLDAFRKFVRNLSAEATLVVCGDDPGCVEILALAQSRGIRALAYGMHNLENDYLVEELHPDPRQGGFSFELRRGDKKCASLSLRVPGNHNVLNASAALVVADILGISLVDASRALSTFNGTTRRFEIVSEVRGVTIVSDYAHHPTEIKATLSAARARYPERQLWAVWQPHTYSRVRTLFDEFATAFQDADHVLITEIYPAREPVDRSYSANQFLDTMTYLDVSFQPGILEATDFLVDNIQFSDVVIVLSAGDADKICTHLADALEQVLEENG